MEGGEDDDDDSSEDPVLTLHLWRADALCGVIEVDSMEEVVVRAMDPSLYPAGAFSTLPLKRDGQRVCRCIRGLFKLSLWDQV